MSRRSSFETISFFIVVLCNLPATAASLEEVVVTATPLRQTALDTAQPVAVLSGERLRRELATSIGETLERQLGVSASYFGPTASRPVIRGLSGERVQMLEDGIGSLDVSALSDDHAVAVEPLAAERIEIIKGPATLLYGNAAVGGVVNVVTHRIPETPLDAPIRGALEARGDSASSERSLSGRFDAGVGPLVFHADAYRRETDDLEIPSDSLSRRLQQQLSADGELEWPVNRHGTLLGTDSESEGGAFGASYVGDRGFFGASYGRFDSNYGTPGPETLADGGSVRIDMTQQRYDLKGELRDLGAGWSAVRVRATHNDYRHQEFEPDGAPGTVFQQHADEARLSFDHEPLAQWRGTLGLQYRDVRFRASGEEAFVPPSTTTNVGAFVFEERPFGPLKLEVGARVESQRIEADEGLTARRYDDTSLNASSGVSWKFTPAYSVALNVTRSQRHPSASELYADGPHVAAGRYEIGDESLRKETAMTADLTFRRYAGDVRFALTAFASHYDDYIFAQPTGESAGDEESFPVVRYAQSNARFHGVEGEIELPLYRGTSSTMSLRLASDLVRAKLDDGRRVPQMPPWRAGAEVEFARERWHASVSTYHYAEQDRVASNELPTDAYTMVDADVAYEWPLPSGEMHVFLRGTNLADEEARRSTSPLKEFAPLAGRSVAAGVRYVF